ncbi:NADP-dependent aldehyde dehydrogenase [Lutibacter agarilyticus]|uniref:NADP-dependent aldehyde dehydrogenase n=1 Tax=Lutibacter agarilyticus TaxID=1109740 RepID=A0A238WLM0_9FLAO|nr:aldehyde dehydrogenase (NADP(+)) [Lutibacter agarilyticus]SNR47318.1 NADP-dependent aldehyde dehydrogenase [Lutibacter agarilyticus]
MITGKNYIGNLLSSVGNKTFKTFNPIANKENDTLFVEASEVEILQATELAAEAYKLFQKVSGHKKSEFLNEIANQIENLGDTLLKTYCLESGFPESRAITERGRTIFQLYSFANLVKEGSWVEAVIETANPNRTPIPKVDLRKMLVALGPVVVFGASNFPLAYSTAGGDTAAAFAAGCPVIVKSHPMHAGTGELVASAIIKAAEITGMPNGVFSNLNSSGIQVGISLVKNPKVKAVGFTGSIQGGRALYNLATQRDEPIPVFAEMGSINPVILLPKAAKLKGADWAKTYASSITLGSGQFCTNPGLILGIKGNDLSNFIQVLSEEIVQHEPNCMLHPTIIGAYESNKATMLVQKGLKISSEFTGEVAPNYGRQLITTVEGATFLENTKLHQEVFGPFSMVVQCKNKEELAMIISNLEGQLTGTILAENEIEDYTSIVNALKNRVGRIIFNGVPTGVEVCPAMVHGGPYPASTDSRFTAVGTESIKRWVRPFSYQNWPNELLPNELKNENSLGISRLVNGVSTKSKL